jgi:hypothetical protein
VPHPVIIRPSSSAAVRVFVVVIAHGVTKQLTPGAAFFILQLGTLMLSDDFGARHVVGRLRLFHILEAAKLRF